MLPEDAGRVLLPLARAAIAAEFDLSRPEPSAAWLGELGASFVTLTIDGQLRGCIGSLLAYQPLGIDVQQNARRAAFQDRRFPPLTQGEFSQTTIEVSVLTAPERIEFTGLADAQRQLQPGIDGVTLQRDGHRATFLPQVWKQLPKPAAFLRALCEKAGLAGWEDGVALERYRVQAWKEEHLPE